MSENWIKANVFLGDRTMTFVVPLRRLDAELPLRNALARCRDYPRDNGALDEVEAVAKAVITRARPALGGGALLVWALGCDLARNEFQVVCTHPTFPRSLTPTLMSEGVYLDPCPGCGRNIPARDNAAWNHFDADGQARLYCTRDCAERKPTPPSSSPAKAEISMDPPVDLSLSAADEAGRKTPGSRSPQPAWPVCPMPTNPVRRKFVHDGRQVEEVMMWWGPGTGRGGETGCLLVAWSLAPWIHVKVAVPADPTSHAAMFLRARRTVKERFDEYWKVRQAGATVTDNVTGSVMTVRSCLSCGKPLCELRPGQGFYAKTVQGVTHRYCSQACRDRCHPPVDKGISPKTDSGAGSPFYPSEGLQ